MKRYLLSIATLFLVFLLSGCGGGGSTTIASSDTTAIEDAELITPELIITDASHLNFTLKLHVQKNLNGNYIVELNNLDLQVNGCTIMASSLNFSPASLYMDGNALSKKDIDVSGSFTAQCTNTDDYTLLADQKVTFSGQVEYSKFVSSSQNTNSGGTTLPTTGYSFYNAATPLVISQPNTTYEIKAQLLKDGFIASASTVQLMPFSSLYGNVGNYSVTTGGDGYAKFNYTSPSVLPANGTSTTVSMVFLDENNQTYTQNIELAFNTSGSGGTTPYGLVNVTTPIEITAGNQEKNITVYVVETSTNIGVSGKDVTITTIANGMGSVSASTATTDASGKAVFFYTAPASISGLTSTTAKLRFTDNGIISEKEVVINFTPPVGGGTQYSLINETNIVVTAPDSTKDISINLTDTATGIGVPNKDVSITTIDATYGEISVSTVKTDAAGKAIFPYTAPATLVNGTINATISFIDDTGTTISKTITITTIAPAGGGTQNAFVNETNLTVTAANTDYQISVDLINSSTGVGVSAEDVSISSIANIYGSISPSISTTNTAGRALFTYTSPITLSAGNTIATVRYTDANGITISKNITITVTPPTGAANQYKLINETTPINITQPSEQKTVSIYVVDSVTGVGIDNKTVTISTLANAYGSFTSSTASTDASGKASFTYIAPSDISGLGTQTATLRFTENGVTLSKDVNFTFNPITGGLSSIDVLPLDSNVSAANEVKSINVYVKDSIGRPVDKASVIVEFFDAKYGTMNTYEDLTDSNGHIEFIYVAPSDIDSLDGQAFDFNISLKSNTSITQNVKIGFSKAVNTSPVADIYVAPNDMTIIRAGEVRTFKVTTVDSRNYAVSANLKIENPTQNGVDYGSFDVSDFTTDALGNKIITYTAPASLVGLNDRNITIVELDTNIEKILTLHFQQPATAAISYDLNLSVDSSIAVDSTGTLGVSIHETGKPNDFIDPVDVISVNATMKFPKMLLFDANQTSTSYSGKNIHSLALFAQHFSGVAVIIVNAVVFNGVSNVTITQEFPVVITSGPVASMSMFHSRNSFDTNSGLYQDFYTIHAVDKYGNPVQEGTALHPTLINGVKEQNITGAIATGTPSIFSDSNADFSTVVDNIDATAGDRLIILPSPGKTSKYYMGDWSVKSHTATTLTLDEQYDDVAETGLSYVVGNESREVTVNGVSLTVTADISSPSDSFQTNAQGNMEFVVSYDPALKGKIFYLAANGPSNTKRIGTALKSSFFYGGYQLRSLINEIKLSNPGDSFSTGFYMLDSTGQTYTGQYNVFIDNFDATKGGFAIDNERHDFQYFAPSNPDEFNALIGTSYEFNLSVSESEETFETIIVQFTKGTDYTNYAITSTENNFTISQPNQQHGLSFYVSDGTNAVDGANVSVDFIDPLNGSMQTYQAQTNVSGRADFTYIAPSDLALLYANPVTIHAYVSNNRATDINVTALFVPGSVDDYKLTNENNITINYAGESKEIAVQLIKNGVPQAGENIIAKSIPAIYGTISSASVATGTDGYARFTYIAADPLTDVNTTLELLYTDANGVEVTTTVDINISAQAQTAEYNLTNVTTPITINYDNELKTISVDVIDSNGIGVSGQSVSITSIVGVEFGSIVSDSTTQTDNSGHAFFTYKAPASVADVDGNTTTVTLSMLSNGVSVTSDVSINFSKVDLNVTVPIVVVANQYKEINLTQNSQNVQIEVQVFDQSNNTPYTSGNVKVSLPSEVLTGTDVGSFSEYVVPVASNGKAVFNYTGPQDLQTLTNNGDLNATFQFFHEDNPTQKEDVTVVYDLQAGYIPANYILSTSSSDGSQTMGLEILKSFTLYLKDDQGTLIDDADITTITLVSKNTLIGKLVDAANSGSNEDNLTFSGANAVNSKSFSIQTYRISGLLPIEVTVDFNDANGDAQSLTIIMNIVVLSGPPTAMSISYAGVEENSTVAKFTEKFVVTVTDSYNNPVNTQPYVAVGAIVEYAVDGSDGTGTRTTTSPRLWHGSFDTAGDLNTIGGNKAQFETVTNDFSYVDFNNDRLVLFGNGFVYEALGKWDILDSGSANILDLQDDYNGADRAGLYFAVGHNNRQDLCANDGRQYVGNMKANNYQLDTNGHALVSFEYDYHLTGKDIMVWVNLTGFQADQNRTGRIGEAIKHTLRGNGFTSPDEYLIPAGTAAATYRFTVHHATVPEWYRNGHFGFGTQGTCTVNGIVDSSNAHDARDCANTVGYVDLSVSNSGTADCTIKLDSDSIGVSSEFTGVSTY